MYVPVFKFLTYNTCSTSLQFRKKLKDKIPESKKILYDKMKRKKYCHYWYKKIRKKWGILHMYIFFLCKLYAELVI